MSDPFIAEIRMFAGNFAPRGWALCNGQLLAIQQNVALFSLLGTTYGGNGQTTFALPNLQGSAPIHPGQGSGLSPYSLGQTGGESAVSLISTEMPSHTHTASATATPGDNPDPDGRVWGVAAVARGTAMYSAGPTDTFMGPQALSMSGGSQPHNNMPPYLVLNFIIALTGIYPARD
jgi:microcystin-dependent protein